MRTAGLVAMLGMLLLADAAAQAPPPEQRGPVQPLRRVFLNGAAADDVRAILLVDMKVTIDANGNLHLENPEYRVERRPGLPAQVVRVARAQVQAPTGPPTKGQVFLVADVEGHGQPIFDVQVYASGRLVTTYSGNGRLTLNVTEHFRQGDNIVRFKVVRVHRPQAVPATAIHLTLGFGEAQGQTLAIDRVLLRWARNGTEQARWLEDKKVVLDK